MLVTRLLRAAVTLAALYVVVLLVALPFQPPPPAPAGGEPKVAPPGLAKGRRPAHDRLTVRAAAAADPRTTPARPVVSAGEFRRRPGEDSDSSRLARALEELSASDGLYGPGGCEFVLPPGDYDLSDTLSFRNLGSVYVSGSGTGTRLRYRGPPNRPCVTVAGCYRCEFSRLTLSTAGPASCGILVTNPAPGQPGWVTSACRFADLHLTAEGGGEYDVGVNVDNTALGGPDANDEDHVFDSVVVGNYKTAAFRQSGSNVHQITYRDCKALGSTHSPPGRYGVLAAYSCFFTWERGFMHGHAAADFMLADFQATVRIRDFNGENSAAFLLTGGPTGAPLPVVVEGGRWDGLPGPPTATDARPVIMVLNPGPCSIRGMRFVSLNGNWPLVSMGTWGGVPGSYEFSRNHVFCPQAKSKPGPLWGVVPWGSINTSGNVVQWGTGEYDVRD
jgi:hypothetical protein